MDHDSAAVRLSAAVIRQLGHSRWNQENNGWMDLNKH